MMSDLRQLIFAPKVVALIGVSNDPKKLSARPLQFCQQHKFAGKLYLVNPRHDQVLGQPAFSSVSTIPDRVDHAYILLSTKLVEARDTCNNRSASLISFARLDGFEIRPS